MFLSVRYFIEGKRRLRFLQKHGEKECLQSTKLYAGKKIGSKEEINNYIMQKLLSGESLMVARYGYTEMFVMRTFQFKMWWNYKKAMKQLCLWSGFFPERTELGNRFVDVMRKSGKQIDVLGAELEPFEDYYISHELKKDVKVTFLNELEPWKNPQQPWTSALKGKRVLVIHPFVETIKKQYKKRECLFPGTEILPEFELLTLKAVQTIAGQTDARFQNWFEALHYMYQEAIKQEFDVAIIGCGAYGLPLAAMLKEYGKQAIHLGGAVQILFGIRGKRWDRDEKYDYVRKFYTNEWVYPNDSERPEQSEKVEGGCYW